VAIHDYHTDGSGAFLVMQYVHGESLSQMLGRVGRLSPDATMHLIAQAAAAIHAVHAQGIVHRDIKPANLMVRPDGTVMVTDFGIARTAGSTSLTSTGAVLGTPSYLAPEQVMGEPATVLSDVYALGLVAYECLAGHRPFEGDNPYAIALQRLHQAPRTLVSSANGDVLRVIERALATEPAQRWSTAADMASAARAALHNSASAWQPAGPAPAIPRQPSGAPGTHRSHPSDPRPGWQPVATPPRQRDRRRLTYIAIATAAVLLAGVAAWVAVTAGARPETSAGASHASTTGLSSNRSTSSTVPAGFRTCGTGYCPTVPACWDGLVIISGVTATPASVDCTQPHYWQTFAAANLPAAAVHVPQENLMQRSDVAGICSASALAHNSRNPAHTNGWRRDALPVQQGDGRWLVYCIANSPHGETTGSIT
jgi:eukaryotic-like serine/threonine-protein kinase